MNIKHLDTLVGFRSPEHQWLYDTILNAAMTLEIGDTLVDGILKITRITYDGNYYKTVYKIDYNNRIFRRFNNNICSIIPNRDSMFYSLDEMCRHLLGIGFTYHEPWEVN